MYHQLKNSSLVRGLLLLVAPVFHVVCIRRAGGNQSLATGEKALTRDEADSTAIYAGKRAHGAVGCFARRSKNILTAWSFRHHVLDDLSSEMHWLCGVLIYVLASIAGGVSLRAPLGKASLALRDQLFPAGIRPLSEAAHADADAKRAAAAKP